MRLFFLREIYNLYYERTSLAQLVRALLKSRVVGSNPTLVLLLLFLTKGGLCFEHGGVRTIAV